MRELMRYFTTIIGVATVLVSCVNESANTHQSEPYTKSQTDIVASDTVVSPTTPIVTTVSSRELPHITLPVTPTDSASVSLMGATLSVPLGAVEKEVTLSITALENSDLAKLPQGMVNVTRDAAGFRFLPHGKHFSSKDARVTLPVDTLAIP